MKIAVAGKGGAGKTTAITLLATYLSKGSKVLVFDVDTNENLAHSLGFSNDVIGKMKKLRNFESEIFEYTKTEIDWKKRKYTPHIEANYYNFGDRKISNFIKQIVIKKNNLYVGHLGNVDKDNRGIESMCDSFTLMRIFLNHITVEVNSHLLVDLAAGNDLITRSTIINMDSVLLVVEPTSKNLTVAKDILISFRKIGFDKVVILVNKSFDLKDVGLVSSALKIDKKFIIRIPFSQEILELDNVNKLNFKIVAGDTQKEIYKLWELLNEVRTSESFLDRVKRLDERIIKNEI